LEELRDGTFYTSEHIETIRKIQVFARRFLALKRLEKGLKSSKLPALHQMTNVIQTAE
jgi:hypothetical protein